MIKSSVEIVRIELLAVRPSQAAQMLSISLRKFAEMKASGLLPPSYKLGGCSVFLTSDLKLWAAWGFPCLDRFLALQAEERTK
jgi:hypothetical protein